MATNTPNLVLRKPEGTDLVNVLTDLSDNFDKIDKVGRGEVAYVDTQVVSATLNNVTLTDVAGMVTASFNVKIGRKYKVTLSILVHSTVAADRIEITTVRDAATTIQDAITGIGVANEIYSLVSIARFVAAADVATTIKIQARRRAGTGVCTIQAAATYPALILVEDIGLP